MWCVFSSVPGLRGSCVNNHYSSFPKLSPQATGKKNPWANPCSISQICCPIAPAGLRTTDVLRHSYSHTYLPDPRLTHMHTVIWWLWLTPVVNTNSLNYYSVSTCLVHTYPLLSELHPRNVSVPLCPCSCPSCWTILPPQVRTQGIRSWVLMPPRPSVSGPAYGWQ